MPNRNVTATAPQTTQLGLKAIILQLVPIMIIVGSVWFYELALSKEAGYYCWDTTGNFAFNNVFYEGSPWCEFEVLNNNTRGGILKVNWQTDQ